VGAFKVKIVERQGGLIFEAFKTTVDQSLTNLSKFVASRHREKKRVTATKDVGSCRDQKRDQRMWAAAGVQLEKTLKTIKAELVVVVVT